MRHRRRVLAGITVGGDLVADVSRAKTKEIMLKKIAIAIVVVIIIGGGAWYYFFSRPHHTQIDTILSNPKAYEGKEVTIEGEVTDRTAFFIVVKFFKAKDKTGEITVVTKKSLPELRSIVRIKGKIDQVFPVGDQKLLVFAEESIEEMSKNK